MDRIIEEIKPSFPKQPKLLRVAAYARVSSGKDAMLHSLSAQVSYYSDLIQNHPGWVYCGVYTDEGISGTNTKHRAGFNEMISDALAGKIDLIITKSISRFARNTVDTLTNVRKLKEHNVEVYFEKENIYTFDSKGEVPQYYIEHSHEAIIPPEDWQLVQLEMARRKSLKRKYSGNSVFGARLVCEDCGGFFGAKTWNSTNKYRRTIWQCNDKFEGESICTTPHLVEDDIKARFLTAYNSLLPSRDGILSDCRMMYDTLTDTTAIDAEMDELLREAEVITELTRKCIEENAASAQNQEEFTAKYNGYEQRYEAVRKKVEKLQHQMRERQVQADSISAFMFELRELDEPVTVFDEKLWLSVIDIVTVRHDGTSVFRFRNGMEVEA